MENLLDETKRALKFNGKSPQDVKWVGSYTGTHAISWEEFEKISNFEYDDGFGSNNVGRELVVVGDNWWLARGEYDGSEWWSFNTLPTRKEDAESFTNVKVNDCYEEPF